VPTCTACGHENSDAARFCEACGSTIENVAGERRKVVSVLFCDVVGSTALAESADPESVRALLARYFVVMRGIVESHEGSVEKFIGDAVMAVFGVPAVHEDDALRACRAAVEMREAFADLGIEGRIGICTGEVVTGTEERLATGDALNVAARLQTAAAPGEILIAAPTLKSAGETIDVEPVGPLALKGKSEPVTAYRLLAARAADERRHDNVFVGREREVVLLNQAWGRAVAEDRCQLVTVIGDPGIGKSRLAAEVLGSIGAARVVRGRCLAYGAGITYWPVVEVVKQLDALPSNPAAAAAIRSLLGKNDEGTSAEEIGWAFRKLLEEQAPLVVVFDDIQWAEETFLDLIEHVALLSAGAPILLLCMARPELLEARPTWPVTVRLEPLTNEDAERLIGEGFSATTRAKIAVAAAGNPLFIGEMLSMGNAAQDEVAVPATLKALLAARLDQLAPADRRVLERGAVEGEIFHRGAVQALAPEETQVTPRLAALVRRQLIRSERAQFMGEDGFRFRHLLVRDTAYDALSKATRAALHERLATWIGEHADDLVERDEVVGYHLEQAYGYLTELVASGETTRELACRAADRLASAGQRANLRGDVRAATSLLVRAADLYPRDDPRRLSLLPPLGRALFDTGEWDRANEILTDAIEAGTETGDQRLIADASVALARLQLHQEVDTRHEEIRRQLDDAVLVFKEAGDNAALARALGFAGQLRFWRGDTTGALADLERSADHAHAAGDRVEEQQSIVFMLLAIQTGPMPATEALRRCALLRADHGGYRGLEASILRCESRLEAMRGNFERARELIAGAAAIADELGLELRSASIRSDAADNELLAGNPAAAERLIRPAAESLFRMGDYGHYVTVGPVLADALVRLDRDDEATEIIDLVAERTIDDDLDAQIAWRRVRARLLARQHRYTEAEQIAREGIERANGTDFLDLQARAYQALADVLAAAGRPGEALVELRHACELFEHKGNVAAAANAQARETELQASLLEL
jgi:class 3 adenylate cyclase/tetratricopeptide (TPR) repeat protein